MRSSGRAFNMPFLKDAIEKPDIASAPPGLRYCTISRFTI
jgi:hypothetical protein